MAFASFSASSQLPKLPEKAFHPDKSLDFPSREFGKNNIKLDFATLVFGKGCCILPLVC